MTTAVRHASAFAEINITPLVDVMLVLLVIFMLATPLLTQRLEVTVAAGEGELMPNRVAVHLEADGAVRFDGLRVPAAAVAEQLAHEARRKPQPVIVIDAADAAPYAALTELLAATERAGLERVGFADL